VGIMTIPEATSSEAHDGIDGQSCVIIIYAGKEVEE